MVTDRAPGVLAARDSILARLVDGIQGRWEMHRPTGFPATSGMDTVEVGPTPPPGQRFWRGWLSVTCHPVKTLQLGEQPSSGSDPEYRVRYQLQCISQCEQPIEGPEGIVLGEAAALQLGLATRELLLSGRLAPGHRVKVGEITNEEYWFEHLAAGTWTWGVTHTFWVDRTDRIAHPVVPVDITTTVTKETP